MEIFLRGVFSIQTWSLDQLFDGKTVSSATLENLRLPTNPHSWDSGRQSPRNSQPYYPVNCLQYRTLSAYSISHGFTFLYIQRYSLHKQKTQNLSGQVTHSLHRTVSHSTLDSLFELQKNTRKKYPAHAASLGAVLSHTHNGLYQFFLCIYPEASIYSITCVLGMRWCGSENLYMHLWWLVHNIQVCSLQQLV